MPDFIKGLDLSEAFYTEAVEPLLRRFDPHLSYSAGLLGFGSDVLGYDTEISRDHMWGPRLYLFLPDDKRKKELHEYLAVNLPLLFLGYPVNFSRSDGEGIRRMEKTGSPRVDHLIFITTIEEMVRDYLGHSPGERLTPSRWLTMGEHRLLAFTSGRIFHDDLGLERTRGDYLFYPGDVALFLMASLWEMISQKEAFIGRCEDLGDGLGTRLNTAAIVQYIMRLAFLWEKKYAPYGKWFGTAFAELKTAEKMAPLLKGALDGKDRRSREDSLCAAYVLAGEIQNGLQLCRPVPPEIKDYYGRPYPVLFAGRYGEALSEAIGDDALRCMEKIGSVSQFSDVCQLYDRPELTEKLRILYE